MSLENTILNDVNISLATIENPFTTVNTQEINVDGLTIFRENDKFYKKDEATGIISKLSTGNGQVYKWYKIRNRDDIVYLDGDLIIDNVIYLNGNVIDNYDISDFSSNIDNTVIKFIGVGFGAVTNELKDKEVTSDYVVVNDAWKQFTNVSGDLNLFTSKSLVVNGNIYVKNTIDNIQASNIYITDLKERSFTAEEIILGTGQWATVDNKLYIDKTIWIDGDIIASGNINSNYIYYDPNNIDHNVLLPDISRKIETVNIKDNLIVNNHKTILKNEQIELKGHDIHLLGSNVYLDGELFFHQKYIQVLKEVYEHTVIYNAAGMMQKRTAFTGQIPIKYGVKHEVGYDMVWTTEPTHYDIFKVSGDIFLTDTTKTSENGFRIITDFVLTINPKDDGFQYPGLDVLFDVNNRYRLGILEDMIDIKVTRVSAKHIKLSMNWETKPFYKELYYASMDITTVIPKRIGRRLFITPYHIVHNGDESELVDLQDIKPFIKLDLSDYDETNNDLSNLHYQSVNIANVKILGDGGVNDRTSLTVYKTSLDNNIHIAEFWDKNASTIEEGDCFNCANDHYDNGTKVQGVVIGRSGIMSIGIEEKDKEYSLEENHPNSNLAQLNITSSDGNINRLKINSRSTRSFIVDNNANVIIGNSKKYNERRSIVSPMVHEYALDVSGHTLISGSLMLHHNNIMRSYFNVKNHQPLKTRNNILEMYITWDVNAENSVTIFQPINLDIDYYISSIDLYPIKTRQQNYNILLNPRNVVENDMPNIISILEKEGQTTRLFKDLIVTGTREDYNAVKIIINATFAVELTEIPFSTIAYTNVTITGENVLNQFFVTNREDFFGLLSIDSVPDLNLILTIGTYSIDLYDKLNIIDKTGIFFEIVDKSINDINAVIDNSILKIYTNVRNLTYNFKIRVLNRRYQIIGTPLTIYITEIPRMYANPDYTLHIIDELIIDEFTLSLYQFYNLYTEYQWEYITPYIRLQSTFNIDPNTSILTIKGLQSGELKNIEVSVYYLNNEGTDYILIDSTFNIQYVEIKQIKCLYNLVVEIAVSESITLNLFDYFEPLNVDLIRFNVIGIDRDIITDNKYITFIDTDIGKSINIIGYYDNYYDITYNNSLMFLII